MPSGIYKRKPFSEEHKRKISEYRKGKKMSEETKEKMKESITKKWQDPKYREKLIGKTHSLEVRKKQSELIKEKWKDPVFRDKMSGENNHAWNPNRGEVYAPYGPNFYNQTLRKEKWIFQNNRDMLSGTKLDKSKKIDYHHIDYDKSNDNPNNHCFLNRSNHRKITANRRDSIQSEKYKKILQENNQDLKDGLTPRHWSLLSKEFRQEKLKTIEFMYIDNYVYK